jgi:hypothetical protein
MDLKNHFGTRDGDDGGLVVEEKGESCGEISKMYYMFECHNRWGFD